MEVDLIMREHKFELYHELRKELICHKAIVGRVSIAKSFLKDNSEKCKANMYEQFHFCLKDIVADLPKDMYLLYLHRYDKEKSINEVAGLLNISESSLKRLDRRLLKFISTLMKFRTADDLEYIRKQDV